MHKSYCKGIALLSLLNILVFSPLFNQYALPAPDNNITGSSNKFPPEQPLTKILNAIEQINEPFLKAGKLIKLSNAYIEIGDNDLAGCILGKAIAITRNIDDQFCRPIILSELIDSYLNLKNPKKALEIAQDIRLEDARSDALIKILNFYIRQGQYKEAIQLTKEINEPFSQGLGLCLLVNEFKEKQVYKESLELQKLVVNTHPGIKKIINSIYFNKSIKPSNTVRWDSLIMGSPIKDPELFISTAQSYISLNQPGPASEMLFKAVLMTKNISSAYWRNDILTQAACAYAQIGDYQKAFDIVSAIKLTLFKSKALAAISVSYTQKGNYQKAMDTLNYIKIPFDRSQGLAKIAESYIQSKNWKNAFDTLQLIDNDYIRDEIISQIIIQRIKANQEKEALAIIDNLAQAYDKSRIYLKVTNYYSQNKRYLKAIELSRAINDPLVKLTALLNIARDMQHNGSDSPKAKDLLADSLDSLKKASLL